MHNVISYYALTDQFKLEIERANGPVSFTAVGALRNLGMRALLAQVRRLKADRMTVAIANDSARPLAGPLLLLATLSGSRNIQILWPDHRVQPVSRFNAIGQFFRIAADQLVSRVALLFAKKRMKRLAKGDGSFSPVAEGGNKVLYLDANLSFGLAAGGSVGHTKGVIDGLIGANFDVDYASVKPIPTDKAGARWCRKSAPSLYSFPPELNYYAFNRRYERFIDGLTQESSYAFIYQRMSLHNFSGAWLREKRRIPLIVEYNGSEAWAAANWSEKLALHDVAVAAEKAALRSADLVVTVSAPLRDEIIAAGVSDERIVVYPNCIDPTIFDPGRFSEKDRMPVRAQYGIASNARVASFIGTFGTWHGVDFLAEAIRRLVDEERDWIEQSNLHFMLIGDGLKMAEVRRILDGERFARFVTLTGLVAQKNAPSYLAASDIFLSPHMPNADGSSFFGSPTKLFEYMAMERPIVASDLDQIGEVLRGEITDGISTLPLAQLYKPGNLEGFLAALRDVVNNPAAAQEMATRARDVALANYTWDHHVGQILTRMRELGIYPIDTRKSSVETHT